MVNFTAKERQDLYPGYDATPEHIREPLCKISDGTSCNHYFYQSADASVEDVCRPGHFNFMRDTFRSGKSKNIIHLVSCFLGSISDGLIQVDLHVIDVPASFSAPIVMAVGNVQRFEPCKAEKTKAA